MNKKIILFLLYIIIATSNSNAQNTTTVYYDEDWKGVQSKDFAYHELVYSPSTDPNYRSRFVLRFASGEKEGEGEFVSIDKYDFTKSILGSYRFFYKNGNPLVEYKLDGNKMDYTSYYPNGLIENKQSYVDGKLDGISYHFTEDGQGCFQTTYKDGATVGPYYTFSNQSGNITKYKFKDGKIFQQTPSKNEKKSLQNGENIYQYYVKNGITIFARTYVGYDFKFETIGGQGKYIMADVIITNNTNTPIEFKANAISASFYKKDKKIAARLINLKEYANTVGAVQTAMLWAKEYAEGKAANEAAYSYSASNTEIYYSGKSTTGTVGAAVGAAVGTNGAAIGAAVGASLSRTAYSGNISSSTGTVAYNGAAAYQAKLIAEARVADYANELESQGLEAVSGYLPNKTIMPGESISGKVLFDYEKIDGVELRVPVNGIIYTF